MVSRFQVGRKIILHFCDRHLFTEVELNLPGTQGFYPQFADWLFAVGNRLIIYQISNFIRRLRLGFRISPVLHRCYIVLGRDGIAVRPLQPFFQGKGPGLAVIGNRWCLDRLAENHLIIPIKLIQPFKGLCLHG